MIASVQYNDLRGTAAADVSDFLKNSLQSYLVGTYKSYDGNRYFCNGCTMWISDRGSVTLCFICYDKENGKYLRFLPERDYTYQEAFGLFKRFEVVIGVDINEIEVDYKDDKSL